MIRLAIALLCTVAATGVLASCGDGAVPHREVGSAGATTLFGFNEDPVPRTFSMQARLGMPVRRLPVPWGTVERTRGRWDWAPFDALYASMLGAGLRPLILAIGAPCWARPGQPCTTAQPAADPDFDPAWANYARALAQRYPRAIGIEIWNEPNIVTQFPPRPDPVRYTALLKAADVAIRAAHPDMPVVSGGLVASSRSSAYGIADREFLAGMYAAGARGFMDAIGAHPYPRAEGAPPRYSIPATNAALNRLRRIRGEVGDDRTPIWVTEMGISTHSAAGYPTGVSQGAQADGLMALVRLLQRSTDVPVALIHRLVDTTPTPNARGDGVFARAAIEAGFGVFRFDGTPKPAACDLSRAFGGSLDCP